MKQPNLYDLNTWENFEKRAIQLVLESLTLLQRESLKECQEIYLNRKLFQCMKTANRNLWESGLGGFPFAPTPEGKNPPDPNDEHRAKREDKIPDFYWNWMSQGEFIDNTQCDGYLYFYVECKRLGTPTRTDWILNKNYISNGIQRFVIDEYGYAKSQPTAAMIGYVQSMDLDNILGEVNTSCNNEHIPEIRLSKEGWKINGTSHLSHKLIRSFPVSPFMLYHFWVDLRSHSTQGNQN